MASTSTAMDRDRQFDPDAGLLSNRAFRLLWLACGAAVMGGLLAGTVGAGGLEVGEDGSGSRIEAIAICVFMFPFFIFGPLNGLLADRLPRRGLMIGVDLGAIGLMAGLALLAIFKPLASPWTLTPLVVGGVIVSLLWPAKSALLPALVPKDRLARANAMNCMLALVAVATAVLIGRYLADRLLVRTAFALSAAALLISAIVLLLIRRQAGQAHAVSSHGAGVGGLAEAVRYIRGHQRVARLMVVTMVIWAFGALVWIAAPTLVQDVCGRQGLSDVRLFQSFLVAGLLIGALILTSTGDALRGEAIIVWSLLGITLAIAALAGCALLPISSDAALWVGSAATIVAGVCLAGAAIACNALLQRIVPNRLRGRVFGLSELAGAVALLAVIATIGIPSWSNLAGWIGWVFLGAAVVLAAGVAKPLTARLRRGPLRWTKQFWWNLTEFYCRWWFRLRREGPCTVPAEGPVIVVANHTCGIDPLLLIASTAHRLIGFLVAEEYTHIPIGGRLIHMIGCVPVRRDGHDAAGTRAALRHLRAGNVLGIFIEGGIPEPGEVREPKLGAAMLALHSGALIVPVHVSGTYYSESIGHAFLRRHHARVRFGKPIDLSRYWIPSGDKEALRKVSLRLLEQIRQLGPEGEVEDDLPVDITL